MKPILTGYVGNNADLFHHAMELYVPKGSTVADVTYGKGVFWQLVKPGYKVIRSDMLDEDCDLRMDATHMAFRDDSLDAIVFDPPYSHSSSTPLIDTMNRYQNNSISGRKDIFLFYLEVLWESRRVLKPGGIAFIKCQDEIEGGKQYRNTFNIWQQAIDLGYEDVDRFYLLSLGIPTMRHPYQLHARKNVSELLVFAKPPWQPHKLETEKAVQALIEF